jgi:histidinol dehydrogenase
MLPILRLPEQRQAVDSLLARLRLSLHDLLAADSDAAAVAASVRSVLARGDDALVEIARRFDDPDFTTDQIRVPAPTLAAAHARITPGLRDAIAHSVRQVRAFQQSLLPRDSVFSRDGVSIRLRWSAIDSVGLYVPGGTASYPSSLIMLAVPALVAGVRRVVVCTPPGRNFSDALLAAAHEVGITELYRVGGVAAVAALAAGTPTIPPVDKILGPGSRWVQLAKRLVSGAVGVDGFLGPSEILVLADDTADPAAIAADMLAQAEHDPGSCLLLTTSTNLLARVAHELTSRLQTLPRRDAVERSFADLSAAVLCENFDQLMDLANRVACEHVSVQFADPDRVLSRLRHGGCVFVGRYSPVAAGDYVAGPSHCLPTNTTARFESGVSVYTFLKRQSVVTYQPAGLAGDAAAITTLARAEGLEAHARSVEARFLETRSVETT